MRALAAILASLPALAAAAQPPAAPDPPIGPRDALEIRVFDAPELDRKIRVLAEGVIELPLVGVVPVAGLTVPEAEAAIERRLDEGGFLVEPQVSIFVLEMVSHTVSIQGAVAEPGVYPLRPTGTLVEMIGAAGGLTDEAGPAIVVRRALGGETLEVPTAELFVAGNLGRDVALGPGDTVLVPVDERRQVLVAGAVAREGPVAYRASEGMTVARAVTAAGGAKPPRAGRRVTVVRARDGGGEERLSLDLEAIGRGAAEDVALEPGDLVLVGR